MDQMDGKGKIFKGNERPEQFYWRDGSERVACRRDGSAFHAIWSSYEEDFNVGVRYSELISYCNSWNYVATCSPSCQHHPEVVLGRAARFLGGDLVIIC